MTGTSSGVRVAVVGATGAVGEDMRRLLWERRFPLDGPPVLVASPRSVGRRLGWGDTEVEVRALSPEVFDGVDIALFSAGAAVSREWAPIAAARGAVVVDNSSAWRRDPDVPLVVAEVNPDALAHRPKGIIANPNCTTMVLMLAAAPLHRRFGLRAMTVTSYQSASGAGQRGIDELLTQVRKLLEDPRLLREDGRAALASVEAEVFSRVLGFNVLAHCGRFAEDRYTDEEWKLVHESRRILDLPELEVAPTCVRVPVVVGHSIAARLTFATVVDRDEAVAALTAAPGVRVVDGVGTGEEPLAYPTPLDATGTDDVLVGRIRRDLHDPHSLLLWVVGDNLRKGAALNAVQLAELVVAGA